MTKMNVRFAGYPELSGQMGHVTGFVQYAPMLILQTAPPQDVRGQNIAIKASVRKSLAEHPYVLRRDALRLARVPKHHFRHSVLGNLFKGLESQSTHSGLNCSYPVTGPYCWTMCSRHFAAHGSSVDTGGELAGRPQTP